MIRPILLVALLFVGIQQLVAGAAVSSVVTKSFFNGIISQANSGCAGKKFYTRGSFLKAAESFPKFGHLPTNLASKREIAAFFAHVTHETGHFCYIEEINKGTYCDTSCKSTYPCKPGKKYYGRGPIQITWNCNYGAAGKSLHLDLVNHPELVSTSPVVAFKTALWYWMKRVRPNLSKGFAETIRAINGGECHGGNPAAVKARVKYYKKYCAEFGITPGPNLSC